jgi:hypothetical protein
VDVPRQSLREDLVAGWAEVRSRTWYWTTLVSHATWGFAYGILATLGPIIAVTELGGRGVWLAALQASAIGYLAGSLLAGRIHVERAILFGNLALVSYAVPLALFAAAATPWAVVVSYGVAMACLGYFNPTWDTIVQQEIPANVLGRVTAYDWLGSIAAVPLGYAVGPALAGAVGPGWPLAGAAVLVIVALVVPALVPDVRRLRLRRPADVGAAEAVPTADPVPA